jgi:adenosylmethionine-8-amino-7-oxononanoate aminotransferase
MSLPERDKTVVWHPFTPMKLAEAPIGIVRGEGSYLYAENGDRYLDMVSSWWVNLHGHAHPYIAEKVSEQLSKLEHVIFAGFTHEPAIELAERLLAILPDNQSRIFYTDNGSTAVEVGLKMALQYWHNIGKPKKNILALKDAYHGDTFGAMSLSGRGTFTRPFDDFLFNVHFAGVPVPGSEEQALQDFEALLNSQSDWAAFIYEPLVQGTAGMVMHSADCLNKMLEMAKAKGLICIADEVMTGFGRTGTLLASHQMQTKPDIMCLSKGLTGGTMPMGVTSCSNKIFEAYLSDDKTKTLFHGHSYTANPVACSAALASMDLLLKDECQQNISRISTLQKKFAEQISKHKQVIDARYTGTILAIELKTPESTSYFNSFRDQLYQYFISRKIIMRPLGNIIYIIPPYCTSSDDLQYVYQRISELLVRLEEETWN